MAKTIKINIRNIISRPKLTVELLKTVLNRISYFALYCVFLLFVQFLGHFGSILWLYDGLIFCFLHFLVQVGCPSHPEYLIGCLVGFKMARNGPKMDQKWTKNGPKMDQKWPKMLPSKPQNHCLGYIPSLCILFVFLMMSNWRNVK